jgi:hypothetical protein
MPSRDSMGSHPQGALECLVEAFGTWPRLAQTALSTRPPLSDER